MLKNNGWRHKDFNGQDFQSCIDKLLKSRIEKFGPDVDLRFAVNLDIEHSDSDASDDDSDLGGPTSVEMIGSSEAALGGTMEEMTV